MHSGAGFAGVLDVAIGGALAVAFPLPAAPDLEGVAVIIGFVQHLLKATVGQQVVRGCFGLRRERQQERQENMRTDHGIVLKESQGSKVKAATKLASSKLSCLDDP